ncbi:MAG: PAS domain-containing sensor histidine kinase [Bacteroidota bacterium]|nr:PAS domain-containing sensor histidine kinase [Bacteroidota bacterium]
MIRRKRGELLGKNIWVEFKLNSESVFYKKYHSALAEKIDIHFEEYSYFMGGWLEIHAYPSKDGLSVYFRSINERKEAEEKQKESEEWFKAVLATSRDGFAVELNEKLIYMNNAFFELFGYQRIDFEVFKDVNVKQFYAEESLSALLSLTSKRSKGEQVPSVYECKGKKKDGSILDLEISASVLNMKEKNYIIVLARDNPPKKAEIKLIEQNEELLKINSELDRFVYSASHDLRAPLMSILGLINIAKIETKEETNLEYLNLMTKSIHKLDKFVQDIIHYSRNSRLALKNELIDFESLLLENLEEVKYLENAEKIEKLISVEQKQPFYSDKSRICVVLNNIISNAIKYFDYKKTKSFIKISIKVDAATANIEIEDNGIGIASQHVNRIFEMFFRASETNVGSGLGLYIVKETLLKLQGDIQVHSVLGEGTRFSIRIPNLNSAPPEK